jgi:hypothetical protein
MRLLAQLDALVDPRKANTALCAGSVCRGITNQEITSQLFNNFLSLLVSVAR